MSSVRTGLYKQRKLFLGIAAVALVVAGVVGLGIFATRAAHHVTGVIETLAIVIVGALVASVLCVRIGKRVANHTIVELDLATLPAETADASPMAQVTGGAKALTLRATVDALERAAADKRVAGLLVHTTFDRAGMAQVQELRDAILAFRESGKFAVARSDTFGEGGAGNASYYLATACDEIVLQATGDVGLVGLAVESTFVRGALDRLGIDPQFEGRHEFKSAANQLMETAFTGPDREQLQRIIDSQFDQIVEGVAAARGISADEVRRLADTGPLLAQEAKAAGLVDRIGYRDEAVARAKERAGKGAALLFVQKYAKRAPRVKGKGKAVTIAVITGTGAIVRKSAVFGLTGTDQMAADPTAAAIRKAAGDKNVKAILLRVNSPGGSAIASDTIYRETVLAREGGTPVIVSMGNVAASGGYYIAAAADKIVAQPGTITGSIGVISGKPVIAEAKKKIGLTVDEVHTSANALMVSLNRRFGPSEHERFAIGLDAVYDEFVRKVADGRKLTVEQVDKIARGRVWTGEDALSIGLVDSLGGFPEALRQARDVAGLDASTPVRLKAFPKKPSALAAVRSAKGDNSEDPKAVFAALMTRIGRGLGLVASPGALHLGSDERDWFIR